MDAPAAQRCPQRVAALLAALSLVLAGCSSTDAPEATSSPSEGHRGPLSEYLEAPEAFEQFKAADLAVAIDAQERTAACMADAGFEYIPYVAPMRIRVPVSDEGTRDWVARRGYGLSGGRVEGPELEAMAAEEAANAGQPVDPNKAIYAGLSEGTQAAYDLALYGPPATEDDEMIDISTPVTQADGCSPWVSMHTTEEMNAYYADYADLLDRMNAIRFDLDGHPRMVELATEWAHCMSDAGHVYTSPTHAQDSVYAVIQGSPGQDGDPYVTSDEAKALELEVALADYDCKQAVAWDEVRESVTDEVEAQFLEDNKSEIDEYIDYVLQTAADRK